MKPISVCIPAYNEAGTIKNVLQDLRSQDYPGEIIIIVCDNNSTDATQVECSPYNVQIVHEANKGTRYAYQAAMAAAQTDLILVTNADTRLPPNWVSKVVQAYNSPGIVGVGTDVSFYNAPAWINMFLNFTKFVNPTPAMWGVSLSCTKEAFNALGGFNQGTDLLEDAVFSLKLKSIGQVVILKDVTVYMDGRRFNNGLLSSIIEWSKGLGLNAIVIQVKYLLGIELKPALTKFKDIREVSTE